MRFKINRTSTHWEDDPPKPCEGAEYIEDPPRLIKESIPYYSCPRDSIAYKFKTKAEKENEIKCGHWEIEIDTVEDLIKLNKGLGKSLIIDGDEIEIYDDWRE